MIEALDLKRAENMVPQYVSLRNSYADLLLSEPVAVDETVAWLRSTTAELVALAEDGILQGVAILYPDRDGEVAVFTREKGKGLGKRLLAAIGAVARKLGLPHVWAWVLEENTTAQRLFETSGYILKARESRRFQGRLKRGLRYFMALGS